MYGELVIAGEARKNRRTEEEVGESHPLFLRTVHFG